MKKTLLHGFASLALLALYCGAFAQGPVTEPADADDAEPMSEAITLPWPNFEMQFRVTDAGKDIGVSVVRFERQADNSFHYQSETTGTRGLARMLAGRVVEHTWGHWHTSGPRTDRYSYDRRFALRNRSESGTIDWSTGKAKGESRNGPWVTDVASGVLTRQMVDLVLALQFGAGADDISLDVLERGDLRDWRFVRVGEEDLDLPAGPYKTVLIKRERESSSRQTRSWLAPELHYLPVQTEQVEDDGRVLAMQLVSFKAL